MVDVHQRRSSSAKWGFHDVQLDDSARSRSSAPFRSSGSSTTERVQPEANPVDTNNLRGSNVIRHSAVIPSTKKVKADKEIDETETTEVSIAPDENKKAQRTTPPLISYELFMWTWFIVLTVLAIVDRFTWNVWSRQTYSIGAGS